MPHLYVIKTSVCNTQEKLPRSCISIHFLTLGLYSRMQCAGNPMGMFGSPTEAISSCLHILLQLILPLCGSVPLKRVFTVFGTFKCLSPNLPPSPVNKNIKQNRQHNGHDQQKQVNAPFHVSTTL